MYMYIYTKSDNKRETSQSNRVKFTKVTAHHPSSFWIELEFVLMFHLDRDRPDFS